MTAFSECRERRQLRQGKKEKALDKKAFCKLLFAISDYVGTRVALFFNPGEIFTSCAELKMVFCYA